MSTIDETGVNIDTFDETKTSIAELFKAQFGDNISTSDQSLTGILISILAEVVSDQAEMIQAAITARSPLGASGTNLDRICTFQGISRQGAAYSTVSLACTANAAGCTIPSGSRVVDPANSSAEFATDSELSIASGSTGTVSATATTSGAVLAAAGTLTKIVTPVYGWASVTNAAAAVSGYAVETDTQLRYRRTTAARQKGLQSRGAIYRALADLDNVGRVVVYENNTSQTDVYGQAPHSVWAICQGGSDADIAQALYDTVAAGIYTQGSTTETVTDPDSGREYDINFDRVTEVPIGIYLKIRKRSTYPADGDTRLKDALASFFEGGFVLPDGETNNGFSIGETVEYFRLLTAVNSVGGFTIDAFTIGRDGDTLAMSDLPMERNELATLEASDITIDSA